MKDLFDQVARFFLENPQPRGAQVIFFSKGYPLPTDSPMVFDLEHLINASKHLPVHCDGFAVCADIPVLQPCGPTVDQFVFTASCGNAPEVFGQRVGEFLCAWRIRLGMPLPPTMGGPPLDPKVAW